MSNVITLKLTPRQEEKLFAAFADTKTSAPAYAKWQLRPENCVITCYESGKTVFQGKDAQVYAAAFMEERKDILPQAGSDEVGTGDYFGPVCVCATIVREEHTALIERLKIRDSKQIADDEIRVIATQLMEALPHSLLILDNAKYNQVHQTTNMNAIKAKMHNQAYVNLSKREKLPDFRVIDQFTPEHLYYRYVQDEPLVIGGIHFETKAEDKYIAVGAGSMIARYAYLKAMDALSGKYGMTFQKGAGKDADRFAEQFVERYGFDELYRTAKVHFKNTAALEKYRKP